MRKFLTSEGGVGGEDADVASGSVDAVEVGGECVDGDNFSAIVWE